MQACPYNYVRPCHEVRKEKILELGHISIPSWVKITILPEFRDFDHFLCLEGEVGSLKEDVLLPFTNAKIYENN